MGVIRLIDTIIFDLEGVVVDTKSLWDESQEYFLQKYNIKYERKKIKPLLTGKSLIDGTKILQRTYNIPVKIDKLLEDRRTIIENFIKKRVSYINGFENFFSTIKNGYKVAIATSLDRALLDIVNKRLNINQLFNHNVFSTSDIGNISKPNPQIFIYTAIQVNSDVKACIVIEDSPNGIEAAKKAGMFCIGITNTYPSYLLSHADMVIDNLCDIDTNNIRYSKTK